MRRPECINCDYLGRTLAEWSCDYCAMTGNCRTVVNGEQVKDIFPCPVRRVDGDLKIYSGQQQVKSVSALKKRANEVESHRDEIIQLVSMGYTDLQIVSKLKLSCTDRFLNQWRCDHKIYAERKSGKNARDLIEYFLLNGYGTANTAIMMQMRVQTVEKWARAIGIDPDNVVTLPDSQLNLVPFWELFKMWRKARHQSIKQLSLDLHITYNKLHSINDGTALPPLYAYKRALEWWNGQQKRS